MASALLINGTVGAGKTTVAEAVGDLLAEASIPHAVIDVDGLRRSWPSPEGDPFNSAIALVNLRAVTSNFLDAGADRIVMAGVIETPGERRQYEEAVGVPLAVCWLRVDLPEVRKRLKKRHQHDDGLAWHLDRSGELDGILEAAGIEDFAVEGTHRAPGEIAEAVLKSWG